MTRFAIPGEHVAIASSRGKRWTSVGPPPMLFLSGIVLRFLVLEGFW
jgi:hypothetical protein